MVQLMVRLVGLMLLVLANNTADAFELHPEKTDQGLRYIVVAGEFLPSEPLRPSSRP